MSDFLAIYKLHAELAERAALLREEFTKLYTGAIAAIVGAGVLLERFSDSESTELQWVLPVLGMVVSVSWLVSFWSVTLRLQAKFKALSALEEHIPFAFLTTENRHFNPGFMRRKVTGSVMPLAFFLVCATWLWAGTGQVCGCGCGPWSLVRP